MQEATNIPRILEPLWRAVSAAYCVECYDFQYYKKSEPLKDDEYPILIEFPFQEKSALKNQ